MVKSKNVLSLILAVLMLLSLLPTSALAAVTAVTITSNSALTIEKGGTLELSAEVSTEEGESSEVTWSLDGDYASGTSIDTNGTLSASADETAESITVKATSTADSEKYDAVTVTVISEEEIPDSDETPPTLSLTSASDVTDTGATLNFTSDEAGTYYYLVYGAVDEAPGSDTVKAQGDAVAKGTGDASAEANEVSVTNLGASTSYKAYMIVVDASDNASAVSTVEIATTTSEEEEPAETVESIVTLQIGDCEAVGYETLREAVTALNALDSGTVGDAVLQLQADSSVYVDTSSDYLPISTTDRAVTLDLNDKELNFTAGSSIKKSGFALYATGANSFHIKTGTINLSILYISIYTGTNTDFANTITDVNINSDSPSNIVTFGASIKFSLNNVNITGVNPRYILSTSTGSTGTITDCSFICETDADGANASNAGIYASGSTLTISGENTKVEVNKYAIYATNDATLTVNGGRYSGEYALCQYYAKQTKEIVLNGGIFTGKIYTASADESYPATGYSFTGAEILIRGGYYSDTSTFTGKINVVSMLTSAGEGDLEGYTKYTLSDEYQATVTQSGAGVTLSQSYGDITDGKATVYSGATLVWTAACMEDYEVTAATLTIGDGSPVDILGDLVKTDDRTWTYTMTNPNSDYTISFTSGQIASETVIATVGDTEYTSLSTVLLELDDGDVIKLQRDITRETALTLPDGNYTLDLNGHTLTLNTENEENYGLTLGGGSLIIQDSSKSGDGPGDGVIDFSGKNGIYFSASNTTLTLNGGTITGVPLHSYYYAVYLYDISGSTVTVDGAYVKGTIKATANDTSSYNKFEMKSGTVENAGNTFHATAGTEFSMTGGTLITTADAVTEPYTLMLYNSNSVSITGGEIINEVSYPIYIGQTNAYYGGTPSTTIGGSAKIIGQASAAVLIVARTSSAAKVTVNIEGSAVLDGATNAVDIKPYSSGEVPTINITGGYFNYGEGYLPISDTAYVASYPDGKVIDIEPIDNEDIAENSSLADYEGYYRFVDTDDLAYTQTVGETVYEYTYQEFAGTAMSPGGLAAMIETAKEIKDTNNVDEETDKNIYPDNAWETFEEAYAAALRCYDPYEVTHNEKANQVEIDYRSKTLNEALAELDSSLAVSDLSTLPQGTYSVEIEMLHYSGSGASMTSNAVDTNATLIITEDGQFKLQINFEPIVAANLWGHLIGFWVYQGDTPDEAYNNMVAANESTRTEATYSNYYNHEPTSLSDYTVTYTDDGEYPGTAEFTLPYVGSSADYSEMFCYVAVDAMRTIGIGDKPVRLKIKYGTLEAVSTQPTLRLDTDAVSLIAGSGTDGSQTVTATLAGADGYTISWNSSNDNVATVSNGIITAVGAGTCTITATASNGTDSIEKTVSVTVAASGSTPVGVDAVSVTGTNAVAELTGNVLTTSGGDVTIGENSVTINAASGQSGVTSSSVNIPASTLTALGTDRSVTLQTDVGDVKFSAAALAQVQATGQAVTLTVSQTSTPTGIGTFVAAYELTLTGTSGSILFGNGTATVSVPCSNTNVKYAYCVADGERTERQSVTTSNGTASWSTTHFSTWALSVNEYAVSGSESDGSESGGSGTGGTGGGTTDQFFLSDGNYYVDIDLWNATTNEASMGDAAFDNNDQALITVKNGEVTTVQVATNPVDVGEYHSAITKFVVVGATVKVLETGSLTTEPAGNTYTYIKRVSFTMPDDGQPDIAASTTYIDVQFIVPDTPMDAVLGGTTLSARLKFTWSSAEATSDTSLAANSSTAKGTSSITGSDIEDIELTDSTTGIILTTDTDHISDDAKLSVTKLTSGTSYETAAKAMSSITDAWSLYKIVVTVDGKETAPEGSVTLSFPCGTDGLTIYRISDSGTKTVLKGTVDDGYYVLSTSALGLFAIIGDIAPVTLKEDLTDTATGIRLTSTKDVLPDGATLKVTAITSGTSYTAAQTALAGKVDQFEIYTIATQTSAGVDTAPTGAVSLYFPIPDGYTDTRVQVYQIADDGTATLISGSVENGYYVISTTTLGTFALVEESAGVLDKFTDIPDGHWARDYIATAVEKGLFSGISETEFSPEGKMTRAMLFTVLYRVSGKTDESSGELWYSTPMAWAEETAISDGTNPDESITREQLVTMLYRYAGSPETSGDFSAFQDADMVSSYAEDALKWAVAQGIVAGTEDGRLNPAGTASRAEVATILVRYLSEA